MILEELYQFYNDSPFLYRITYKRAPPENHKYNKGDLLTDADYLNIKDMYDVAKYFLKKHPQ